MEAQQVTIDSFAPQMASLTQDKETLAAKVAQKEELLRCQKMANDVKKGYLRDQLHASATEIAAVRAANAQLQIKHDAALHLQKEWTLEKESLSKANEGSAVRIRALLEDISELEVDRDRAGEDRDEQMLENDALVEKLSALEAQAATIKDANLQLQEKSARTKVEHGEALLGLSEELDGQMLENNDWEEKVAALEEQMAVLKDVNTQLRDQQASWRAGHGETVQALTKEGDALGERVGILERDVQERQAQKTKTEAGHLQALKVLSENVDSLNGKVGGLRQEAEVWHAEQAALRQTVEAFGRERTSLEEKVRALRRPSEASEARILATEAEPRETVEGFGVERTALRERIWTLQAEIARLGAGHREAVAGLGGERDALGVRVEVLQQEIAFLGEVQFDLTADLVELQAEKAELLVRVGQLEKQVRPSVTHRAALGK
jgi:chromosome segregation ATPase